ncbi:MAG: hypothetical protein JEZ14_25970 [Marinilabiliaceae bacterium]|nr:hypothetical protein [Marinilabiliaceae bacterium]
MISKVIYTYDDLKDSIVVYDQLNASLGVFANAHRIIQQNEDSYWFVLPRKIGLFNWKSNQLEKVMEYYFNDPRMSLVEKFENIVPITNQHSIICLEQGVALIRNELVNATATAESLRFKRITYTYKDKAEIKHPVQGDQKQLRIPYRGNQVSFEVTSAHSSGKQLLYSFNLNGLDNQWSKPEVTNEISFSRLPSGNYNLEVKAYNAFGNVVGSGSYHFEIIPLWYTRTWVIVLFVLLVGIIVFVSIKKVKRHNRQKQERLLSTQHKELMKIQEEQRLLTEKEMVKLRNDNLRKELAFKSNQLASATMASIRKNEVLMELKQELIRQKEVLQYRFPEKYFEKLIRMIERDMTSNEDWDTFEKYFDQAHVNFFSRLKEAYPAITPKDLRLCAYLKMNLTTKEIAPLLSVSPRSVEVHRYRLRKRLELKPEDNLTEFLIAF